MSIPRAILGRWSHHWSGEASARTHTAIREVLSSHYGHSPAITYETFLQGSYKNNTNLQRDSDVDLVVQLSTRIRPRVAALRGNRLEQNLSHIEIHRKWQSFRDQTLKALFQAFGSDSVSSGRKSLKIARGRLPATADVVVTIRHEDGLAFFLPDERRWVVSYPNQHYDRGCRKEEATNNRYKRTIRMFKAARNHLVQHDLIQADKAPSYFIECLLSNVPNQLFHQRLDDSYVNILEYLQDSDLRQFQCQNGKRELFGSSPDIWSLNKARQFVRALARLWDQWPKPP